MRGLRIFLVALALLLPWAASGSDETLIKGQGPGEFRRVIKVDGSGRLTGGIHVIDACEATTGWTALNSDTDGLDTDLDHVLGAKSLEFDKVDGAANTIFGGIQKTISSVDLSFLVENGGAFGYSLNVGATTDLAYCFLRLGTDGSNYNEWRVADSSLSAGWNSLRFNADTPSSAGALGNGWDATAVLYLSLGCAFDLETSLLADLRVDHITANVGLQVAADINASASSSSGATQVDLQKVGGVAVNTNGGNRDGGTATIAVADDDNVSTKLTDIDSDTDTIQGDTTSLDGKVTVDDLDTTGATDNKQVVAIVTQSATGAKLNSAAYPLFVSGAGSVSTTVAQGPTATGSGTVIVLDSTDISKEQNWGLQIENVGANPLTDADVQVSRDLGTTWRALTWTSCDTLAAAATCDYDFPSNSYTNVRAYVTSTAAASVDVTFSSRR